MASAKTLPPEFLGKLIMPRAYQWNFRESNSQLAKRLRVNPETIRLALKRLRATGAVPEWRLIINPRAFGSFLASIELDVKEPEKKRITITNLAQIDGVVIILNYYSMSLRLLFYYENDGSLERKISLICHVCGTTRDSAIWWKLPTPPCEMKFRSTDWEILASLRKDPFRKASSIATQVHTTVRTVNRRLNLMTTSYVGYLMPIRQIGRSKGLTCSYLIEGNVEDRAIDELIISASGQIDFTARCRSDLCARTIAIENIAVAEELANSIRNLKGVVRVKMNLPREFIPVDGWLGDQLLRLAVNPVAD